MQTQIFMQVTFRNIFKVFLLYIYIPKSISLRGKNNTIYNSSGLGEYTGSCGDQSAVSLCDIVIAVTISPPKTPQTSRENTQHGYV